MTVNIIWVYYDTNILANQSLCHNGYTEGPEWVLQTLKFLTANPTAHHKILPCPNFSHRFRG